MGAACSSDSDARSSRRSRHKPRRERPAPLPDDMEATHGQNAAFDALWAPVPANLAPDPSRRRTPSAALSRSDRHVAPQASGAVANALAPRTASVGQVPNTRHTQSSSTSASQHRAGSSGRRASSATSVGTRTTSNGTKFATASAFFYGPSAAPVPAAPPEG
eukprot:CAMPEP_0174865282 /NCGR_PEP_ID=MMETSP1114-20130205/60072_1 /TAXON_ID=312471 /ORGANISM="Neobodo designis, Strain CCAP 1951/1" /LENGTH=161 /DNA_ID=CAMNT_0016100409 /DNA_START=35 /DNA_END=520 /DNA_ORIENTATION=-